MQTFEPRRIPGSGGSALSKMQAACSMVDEDGGIDLKIEPKCEIVRLLLMELRSYRQARRETGWRLDRLNRTLLIGDDRIELTRTQCRIIGIMAIANGEFVGVHDMLMGVWGFAQPIGGGELVRTHIRAIRRRLRGCQVSDDFINSSRGRGYRIDPDFVPPPVDTPRHVAPITGAA